jgi:hypothetical protein
MRRRRAEIALEQQGVFSVIRVIIAAHPRSDVTERTVEVERGRIGGPHFAANPEHSRGRHAPVKLLHQASSNAASPMRPGCRQVVEFSFFSCGARGKESNGGADTLGAGHQDQATSLARQALVIRGLPLCGLLRRVLNLNHGSGVARLEIANGNPYVHCLIPAS